MDYFEKDLEIPFLRVLNEHRNGLPMSDIKKILLGRLNLTGTCNEDSPTRDGEKKISQRIGNFTLERKRPIFVKGYATYDPITQIYKITESGIALVNGSAEAYDSLISQGFDKEEREKELDKDLADMIIEEGEQKEISQKQRKRSKRLKDLKIAELKTAGGKLACCACGFDFEKKYDGVGKDFIIIHHINPLGEMAITGAAVKISDALKKVVPVCSNCHSIIHRDRDKMLSINELKEILKKQENLG